MAPTKSQELMIADGLPATAILTPEERAATWTGRKLSKPRDLKAPRKDEDPTTKKLRKELEAAEKAKATARFEQLAELRKQTQKARMASTTKPPRDKEYARNLLRAVSEGQKAATQESTMKKTAKKTKAKATAKTAKKAAAPKATKPKALATTNARTAVKPNEGGRKAEVIAMMKRTEGVTTQQIQDKTGMKEPSARALISGIVKSLAPTEEFAKSKNGSAATVYTIRPKG